MAIVINPAAVRELAADLVDRQPARVAPDTWPDVKMLLALAESAERRLAGVPPQARPGAIYSFATPGPPTRYRFPKSVPTVRLARGLDGWTLESITLANARPGDPGHSKIINR